MYVCVIRRSIIGSHLPPNSTVHPPSIHFIPSYYILSYHITSHHHTARLSNHNPHENANPHSKREGELCIRGKKRKGKKGKRIIAVRIHSIHIQPEHFMLNVSFLCKPPPSLPLFPALSPPLLLLRHYFELAKRDLTSHTSSRRFPWHLRIMRRNRALNPPFGLRFLRFRDILIFLAHVGRMLHL